MKNECFSSLMNIERLLSPPEVDKTFYDQMENDSGDDLDDDRCYQLEIDQLKRENNFLMKKIGELMKKTQQIHQKDRRKSCAPANIKPPSKIYEQK